MRKRTSTVSPQSYLADINHDIPSVAASTLISPWWLSRSTKRLAGATPRVPGPRSDSLVAPPKEGIALIDLIGWPRCGRQVHQEEPSAQDATDILFHWDPWPPPKKWPKTREIMWMKEWYKQRKIGDECNFTRLYGCYMMLYAISGTKRLVTTDSSPLTPRPSGLVLERLEDLGWQQPLP